MVAGLPAGRRRYENTMKISPQWVREFVELTVDDRRLAEDLTGVGIAVEGTSGSGADCVFEMEIGTNRPDAMNHYGVAREAAAVYDLPLKQFSVLSSRFSVAGQKQTSAAKAASSSSSGGTTEVVPFPSFALARLALVETSTSRTFALPGHHV